jgi:hypothetical protein
MVPKATARGQAAQPSGEGELPPPPIAADVDLRNFSYLPLDVQRLRDSDLALLCPGEAFKANVLLWATCWHQVPAGSLPDDDRWLARHSGAGARWSKVKTDALWGFTKCSDGRWYHRVVVEKAKEAWSSKREQALRTLKARIANTEKRLSEAKSDTDAEHLRALLSGLKASLSQAISESVEGDATRPVTGSKGAEEGRDDRREEGTDTPGAGAPDLRSLVFGQGLVWLKKATSKSDRDCRRLLGKWRGTYGDAALIEALGAAQTYGPIDAISWLTKALQERSPRHADRLKTRGAENFETRVIAAAAFRRLRGQRPADDGSGRAAFAAAFAAGAAQPDEPAELEPIGEASIADLPPEETA